MFFKVDDATRKKEKHKAYELRKSAWWKNQLGKGACHYCKKRVPSSELTMDHFLPISRGGKSKKSNCVPACKDCNNLKGNKSGTELLNYLEKEG